MRHECVWLESVAAARAFSIFQLYVAAVMCDFVQRASNSTRLQYSMS